MAALTQSRNTPVRANTPVKSLPVAAATLLYQGGIGCVLPTGYATKGATASAAAHLKVLGRINGGSVNGGDVDNSTGLAGDKSVDIEAGIFKWANSSAGDAITIADRLQPCYLVDDQTVAKTDGAGTRVPAGIVMDVEADGVWVAMGISPAGYLAPGANLMALTVTLADVSTASIARVVSPVGGRIVAIYSVLGAAITGADSIVTNRIGTTAITGGTLTVAQAGSAAGDVDSAFPTAANVVNPGQFLAVDTDGASTNTATLTVTFLIAVD